MIKEESDNNQQWDEKCPRSGINFRSEEIFSSLKGKGMDGDLPIGWFLNYKKDYKDDIDDQK